MLMGSVGLLVPSYSQQLMHQTPLQAGLHIIPAGLGAMLTTPLVGNSWTNTVRARSCWSASLLPSRVCTFTYRVATQTDYSPTLLVALITGMGSGCTLLPLSGSAVLTLGPRQLARGSTLITVNQMVAGSTGAP
jgi:hypothetical protein